MQNVVNHQIPPTLKALIKLVATVFSILIGNNTKTGKLAYCYQMNSPVPQAVCNFFFTQLLLIHLGKTLTFLLNSVLTYHFIKTATKCS